MSIRENTKKMILHRLTRVSDSSCSSVWLISHGKKYYWLICCERKTLLIRRLSLSIESMSYSTVFFSHNKSANSSFSHGLSTDGPSAIWGLQFAIGVVNLKVNYRKKKMATTKNN
jgi:hypothetical protein